MSQSLNHFGRRHILKLAAAGGGLAVGLASPAFAAEAAKAKETDKEDEVSAVEDLMREHGVLRRILLVYDELHLRLVAGKEVAVKVIHDSADLVRRFVEGYHEKLEEDLVFPRLEKDEKLQPLTAILRKQHAAGRSLTDTILRVATGATMSPEAKRQTARAMRDFNRMYHAHAAWEDTTAFPALHTLVKAREYELLGDEFEKRETEILGHEGYEHSLAEVEKIQKGLGIGDLAVYTPNAK